jgi:hypothetical protein
MWSVEENTDHGVLFLLNTCHGGKKTATTAYYFYPTPAKAEEAKQHY